MLLIGALALLCTAFFVLRGNFVPDPIPEVSFDFTPYELRGRAISSSYDSLDEHNFIAFCTANENDNEEYLTWWRDYEIYREIRLEEGMANYAVIPRPDGSCGVLRVIPVKITDLEKEPEGHPKMLLYDWAEDGLTNERVISESFMDWRQARNGFTLLSKIDGELYLDLYDGQGNQEAHLLIGGKYNSVVRAARDHAGFWAVTLNLSSEQGTYLPMTIRNGEIVWQGKDGLDVYSVRMDEQGGFFHVKNGGRESETYKPRIITRYDGDHNKLWTKTLTGSQVLLGTHTRIDPESGHLILTGSAVANSRKIYRVYRLEVDENWKTVSMDVRECNYHDSYVISVYVSPETGKAFVLARDISADYENVPAVLVPFDALPKAQNPGITLR